MVRSALERIKQIYQSKKDDLHLLGLQLGEKFALGIISVVWNEPELEFLVPEVTLVEGLQLESRQLSFPAGITWIETTPVINEGFYKAIRVPELSLYLLAESLDTAQRVMVLSVFKAWDDALENPTAPSSKIWLDSCVESSKDIWCEIEEDWNDIRDETWQKVCD